MGVQFMSELQMADNLHFLKIFFSLFNNATCHTVDCTFAFSPPVTFPRILQPSITVKIIK